MGKHSRCITDICDNDIQYPVLDNRYNNMDGVIIMHKLPKDAAGKYVWVNTILKGRNQLIQESLYIFATTSLLGWLINKSPVFNKVNQSPVR